MKPNLIAAMLSSHPAADAKFNSDRATLIGAIGECRAICTLCADACLAEKEMLEQLRTCIRLNQDCADICGVTASVLARPANQSGNVLHALLHACTLACQACADECEAHAEHHEHCRFCAATCRHCQELCNFFLGEMSSSGVAARTDVPEEATSS